MAPTKIFTLPGGRRCTLPEYVRSWKALQTMPGERDVANWNWYPVSVSAILRDISRGVQDRINIRAGLTVPDMQTPARQKRFWNRASARANVHCKYCGVSIAYSNRLPRSCPDCY